MTSTDLSLDYDIVKERRAEFDRKIKRAKDVLKRMGPGISTEALIAGLLETQLIDVDAWRFAALHFQNEMDTMAIHAQCDKAMEDARKELEAAQATADPIQQIRHMDRFFKFTKKSNCLFDQEQELWGKRSRLFEEQKEQREKRDRRAS